jgi:Cu2+-containing amine oxidase
MPAGSDNPYGNGFRVVDTPLTSTHQAQRVADPFKGRVWKIKNPSSINPSSKQPVAYKLMPHAAPLLLAQPNSIITQKGHFATKNLWVTPYSDQQKWPAGEYVLQASDCTGLKLWTKEVGRQPAKCCASCVQLCRLNGLGTASGLQQLTGSSWWATALWLQRCCTYSCAEGGG